MLALTDDVTVAPKLSLTNLDSSCYFNRELSWLQFNKRVLEEAMDQRHPLLERAKFLSIFCTNLDEFFMIRLSGIREQVKAEVTSLSMDGKTPSEQLQALRQSVSATQNEMRHYWLGTLRPALAAEGILLLDYPGLNEAQRTSCRDYFEREIFPVLTPLAVDPGHPFPLISNLSVNLAVVIRDPRNGEQFARVKVPAVLSQLIPVPVQEEHGPARIPPERRYAFVWLEDIIAANVDRLFPGMEIIETHAFRIIRDTDVEIQEDEAADLLRTIEEGVRQRRFGDTVGMMLHPSMPARVRDLLVENLKLTTVDTYEVEGPLNLSALMSLMRIDRPDLKDEPFIPHVPMIMRNAQSSNELFAAIRQQDILLHHPFDSFQPLVALIEAAATDPDVLAIKQTLYRVGPNSPIVSALMRAREQDKQVTVLVELKARFDEENNITWARALERVGVHVVYGLVGLKTHAKLALIVRRDPDGLRRYAHLGTGNYNAASARIYTDLGMFTCQPDITADVSEIFNALTGYSRQQHYRKLLVAPGSLRSGLVALIEREIALANAGKEARLIFKLNALVDREMIDLLYQASQAGVSIDLIVRGMCCLRPGVPGLSDTIRVRSIVGRFLEHSRVFYFHNAGNRQIYVGSADLMTRNLDRRVESLFPIEDPSLIEQIYHLLQVYQRDNVLARELHADGVYTRVEAAADQELINSQSYFMAAGQVRK